MTAKPILLFAMPAFVVSAAIPVRWTVETSRVQPAQIKAYHGETIEFAATLNTYGNPLEADLNPAFYWQTNGMGSAYWTAPAILSNNVMIARWTPEMDVGASVYSCFIGAPGEIYRAAFQLLLRPSPGAVPSELPMPVQAIDFSQVEVRNAPYYTRSETDSRISDMETKTHAAATYVQFANSTKTAVTIGGLNTAQSTDGGTVALGRNTRALADSSFAGGHRAMTATGTKYGFSYGNRTYAPTGATALGYQAWASSAGQFANDDSDVVVGLGSKHKYAFIWQGKDDGNPGYYHSHGDGTFNINPIGGLSGVWIGSTNLASYLSAKADASALASEIDRAVLAEQGLSQNILDTYRLAETAYRHARDVESSIDEHETNTTAHSGILSAYLLKGSYSGTAHNLDVAIQNAQEDITNVDARVTAVAEAAKNYTDDAVSRIPAPSVQSNYLYSANGMYRVNATGELFAASAIVGGYWTDGNGNTFYKVGWNSGRTVYEWRSSSLNVSIYYNSASNPKPMVLFASAFYAYCDSRTLDPEVDGTVFPVLEGGGKTYIYHSQQTTFRPDESPYDRFATMNDLAHAVSPPQSPITETAIKWKRDGSAIVVSVAASGTLGVDLTGWTIGQTQTALITLAAGASVSSDIILVGYNGWITGSPFVAECIRVGNKVYVNPVCAVQ